MVNLNYTILVIIILIEKTYIFVHCIIVYNTLYNRQYNRVYNSVYNRVHNRV